MGYNALYDYEIKCLGIDFSQLELLELGDQEIHDPGLGALFSKLRDSSIFKTKKYVTYDLHSRLGVDIFDLSEKHDNYNKFDVITNFGTTEHVEPEIGQYNCWYNIHNLLNLGGMIISIVPCSDGGWEDHCRYYYNKLFFEQFEEIGYELKSYKVINDLNCFSILKKIDNSSFLNEEEFWKYLVIKKENDSNIIYHDNNPKKLQF